MAYRDFTNGTDNAFGAAPHGSNATALRIDGQTVELPDASYVKDATITREGMDLVLEGPQGTVIVEGYFAADPAPNLTAPDGSTLTPQLVDSFTHSTPEYAANPAASDASPVGAVQEVSGHATVTRADGTTEAIVKGTPIFEGDIVQTDAAGAVNIMFVDQTSFAVSEDARLAIDKYVYDPSTQSGTTDFSILKGVFVFTSGMIGREDPDHVKIETPAGSIGIRGTIIAGNVSTGEITVVEGAIVLHDLQGHEVTLATQYETARFSTSGGAIEHVGQLSAHDVAARFSSVSNVSPTLFSSINDSAHDAGQNQTNGQTDATGAQNSGDGAVQTQSPALDSAPQAPQAPLPPAPGMMPGTTGFGAPAGGFGPSGAFGSAPPPGGAPAPGPQGAGGPAGNFGGLLPPLPPGSAPPPNGGTSFDPNAPGSTFDPNAQTPPPPVNHVPFFDPESVPQYFRAAEGQNWDYFFNKDFGDPDFSKGDTLSFQLSANTIANLNNLVNDGGGASPDILAAGGWSFDASNGNLHLTFNSGFGTTPGTVTPFNIEIQAVDQSGAVSGLHSYAFSAYDPNQYLAATALGGLTADNITVGVTSTASPGNSIQNDNSNFFFGAGNDQILLLNNGSVNTGSNNYINLGNGTNNITVAGTAFDNTIVGGNGNDTMALQNAKVKAFGIDGDDVFILDNVNNTGLTTDLGGELRANNGMIIDGGAQGTRGDALKLLGTGNLDFSLVNATNNKISGIERLSTANGQTNTVTLNYNDVLQMTDGKKTLVINADGADTVNLVGSQMHLSTGGLHEVSTTSRDDSDIGGTAGDNYHVYTDGNITLVIHAANVNFDGVNVNAT